MTTQSVKIKNQTVAGIEAELLRQVRLHGRISRVALSRALQIVPSTAGIYVDRLVAEGFLSESRQATSRLGRPATLLGLRPDAGRFVGLDFEARNLMATAVDFSQQPVRRIHKTIRAGDSVAQILNKMEQAIEEVLAEDPRPVLGIGLGLPGVIDHSRGVAVRYDTIGGWRNIPLGDRLRGRFGTPVFLENNIRCMAMAELWFGAGRGLKDFICLGVRSGIGAGIIANGQLLRGATNQAGEIGHWVPPVPALLVGGGQGRKTGCDCRPGVRLEEVASLTALLRLAQSAAARGQRTCLREVRGELALEHLFEAARGGDPYVLALLDASAFVLGWVVWQMSTLFDAQKIILTGRLVELGEFFLASVRGFAKEWGGSPARTEITGSTLGSYSGALGAAALALQQWKPKR